ncbi:5-bromo-4-chloroindolyl phosphate hydrolysis family protein [Pikeienuella sp. HZG-20]|uniref:5-bromo-4-chloroindolyl phosphate hydrolysis family protein n=1 Tax=Paludibacillus litoralis TaxID=3133267 RepID=UPI0030ED4AD3
MSAGKRFGGAHSPGAPPAAAPGRTTWFSGRKARGTPWRVLGLYLAPSPLLAAGAWAILTGDPAQALLACGGWAALIFAARLTGEGIKAAAAYHERVIARPPAFPRKLVAALLTGLIVAGLSFFGAGLGPASALYGLLALGAHLAAFGLDPMRAKGGAGVSPAARDRVASKLDAAEAVIRETAQAAAGLRDRALTDRVDRLAFAARDILREIESDPRDLARARRFLSVYLVGLRDSTVKFAAARAKGAAEGTRGEFEALLKDLETTFARQHERLMVQDQTELEVEIEVLRDRLKQEGAL